MAEFVEVPITALAPDVLTGLLEEYVSRDGTDYGLREQSLEEKRDRLHSALRSGAMRLLYDADSEQWDIVKTDVAEQLLGGARND